MQDKDIEKRISAAQGFVAECIEKGEPYVIFAYKKKDHLLVSNITREELVKAFLNLFTNPEYKFGAKIALKIMDSDEDAD